MTSLKTRPKAEYCRSKLAGRVHGYLAYPLVCQRRSAPSS